MRSPLELKGALSALAVVTLLVLSLTLGDALTGAAVAEPSLSLGRAKPAAHEESTSVRAPIRFASHHEDDEDDEHDDHDDCEHGDCDHDEDEEEELEVEMMHLEIERAAMETFFGALELVEKMTDIAADDDKVAAFAITTIGEELDLEDKIPLLEKLAKESPSQVGRRVAVLQLAEAYAEQDRGEEAVELLYKLAAGQD